MFLHLGGNRMISMNEVIAIIDATGGKTPFNEIVNTKKNRWLEKIEGGQTKSYVVTDYKIYASPISSLTLKKRAGWNQTIFETENGKKKNESR